MNTTSHWLVVTGHYLDDPSNSLVSLGHWEGKEDEQGGEIVYYMNGEPLKVGCMIDENFVITEILGVGTVPTSKTIN